MKTMKNKVKLLCAVLLLGSIGISQAELARVGPIDPNNGYPVWYQDKTGLALEFCSPNATDLLLGNCLILPSDLPNGTGPEVFPGNFLDEHFFWNSTALIPLQTGKALLVMALEGAFSIGPVLDGDQVVFSRIRVLIDVPEPGGTYTVTHPYGVEVFPNVAPGTRSIFFTEDIGLVPGDFTKVLAGRVGPFLQAADPLGNPLPPVVLPGGNTYLADPNLETQVTGSPFGTNVFRIEGPNIGGPGINMIETDLFSLMGRVRILPIPALLDITRATYARDALSAQIDVFATSAAAINGPQPLLSVGGPNIQARVMDNNGAGDYYTTIIPAAPGNVPASVIVTNNGDALPTLNEANLVDELTAQASWDAVTNDLTITASSSDQLTPPALVASDNKELSFGTLVGGTLTVPGILLPPPTVTVKSSAGGVVTTNVVTNGVAIQGPAVADDSAITTEDIPVSIALLSNDGASAVASTLTVIGQPQSGAVTLDGLGNATYTPNLGFAGVDTFTYLVQDINGNASNLATVTITVNNIPNAPVAVGDNTFVPVNNTVIIDVLANDSDADGDIVPSTVTIVTAPSFGTASVNPDGSISYLAGANRTLDTLQYTVSDATGLVSNVATVTIDVLFPEIITVQKAEVKGTDWKIQGDSSIPGPNNQITVYVGPDLTGPVLGTVVVDNIGGWQLQARGSGIPPDATQTISMESSQGGTKLAVPVAVK